jgi:hypothetical protein
MTHGGYPYYTNLILAAGSFCGRKHAQKTLENVGLKQIPLLRGATHRNSDLDPERVTPIEPLPDKKWLESPVKTDKIHERSPQKEFA